VRELLSLRSGRLHSTRSCKRLLKETPHPADLQAPEGPCHGDVKRRPPKRKREKEKKKRKERRRSRKRRRRSSSSRSCSSTSSSDSSSRTSESRQRLFRSARDLAGFANRAQKQALSQPEKVLVESLAELATILPGAKPGASSSSVGGGYEAAAKLPPLFVSYHSLVLSARLAGSDRSSRNEREARTLCEILDVLLSGGILAAIMIALQRLKAIEASIDPQGGGWSHAAQHELTARPGQGLVSQKDRTLANRDVRDEQRSRAPRGLPPIGKGNGKGREQRDRQH
jgi:hypothetical protein